jgi:hypothetical protein
MTEPEGARTCESKKVVMSGQHGTRGECPLRGQRGACKARTAARAAKIDAPRGAAQRCTPSRCHSEPPSQRGPHSEAPTARGAWRMAQWRMAHGAWRMAHGACSALAAGASTAEKPPCNVRTLSCAGGVQGSASTTPERWTGPRRLQEGGGEHPNLVESLWLCIRGRREPTCRSVGVVALSDALGSVVVQVGVAC